MLIQLHIQNFGLIDRITLDFEHGLNIFTGETGAGKSILIGALRVVLGDRISVQQFRDSAKPCHLQATFEIPDSPLWQDECLSDFNNSDGGELIIHRQCSPEGKSKIKINGLSATVTQLKEIGNLLVDFHGPHDHQRLFLVEHHRAMLDRLVDLGSSLHSYQTFYHDYQDKHKQLRHIDGLRSSRDRDLDLLSHQVRELEQVSLDENVYDRLQQDKIRMGNSEKIFEHLRDTLNWLDGDDNGSSQAIGKAFYPLQRLAQLDEQAAPFLERLAVVQNEHDQLVIDLKDYCESLAFEPVEAQRVSDACDAYEDILRKYGPTMADAQLFYEEAKSRLELVANLDHNDQELRLALDEVKIQMNAVATDISKIRQKASRMLKKTIEKELLELGIKNVQFEARVTPGDFHAEGVDQVVFYISPNAGEELKPLADIVSSGEAARVMLALKKALIKVDPVPVLIFDEIDAQIGGRLGSITGQKLKDISSLRQVILITHLPQIASFADRHFKVLKLVQNKRAVTTVDVLDSEHKVKELAQMMSGEATEISLTHAKDMLAQAKTK